MDGNDSSATQKSEQASPSPAPPSGSSTTDSGSAAADQIQQVVNATAVAADNAPSSSDPVLQADSLNSANSSSSSSSSSTPIPDSSSGSTAQDGHPVSQPSATEDQKQATGAGTAVGNTKSTTGIKKTFKPQSLNGIFRQLQATNPPTPAKGADRTAQFTSQQNAQASLNAAKLRMATPKLTSTTTGAYTLAPLRRDLSISPRPDSAGLRPGSAAGSKSSSSTPVWNKSQGQGQGQSQGQGSSQATAPAKSRKDLTEEELKKMGIHLTGSIAVDHKDSKWDDLDDDDDDDWGDTIEFGDGTKVVLSHDSRNEEQAASDSKNEQSSQPEADQIAASKPPQSSTPQTNPSSSTKPSHSSPWAPVPHVQPTSLLARMADNASEAQQNELHHNMRERDFGGRDFGGREFGGRDFGGRDFNREYRDGGDNYGRGSNFFRHDYDDNSYGGYGGGGYGGGYGGSYGGRRQYMDHDMLPLGSGDSRMPQLGSGDARGHQQPIVLSRDSMDFDRSYGLRPSQHELFNDRSGQIEPVRRKSFNSKRPGPPGPAPKALSVASRDADEDNERHSRRPSASSSEHPVAPRRPSLDRTVSPSLSARSVFSEDHGRSSIHSEEHVKSASHSPSSTFSQLHHEGDSPVEPTARPSHITAKQEMIMKHSIENARKRKEEEQRREQERLEAARKRAEEIVRKKQLQFQQQSAGTDATPSSAAADKPSASTESSSDKQEKPQQQQEQQESASAKSSPVKQSTTDANRSPVMSQSRVLRNDAAVKIKRKASTASSDAEGIDASVTAAIETLISESSAGHSPPATRASLSKLAPGHATSGWDHERGAASNRGGSGSWPRNGLHDNARTNQQFRSFNDNVWGPVGSSSRYPAIDGVGNGAVVDHRSFMGHGEYHHGSSNHEWKPNTTPAQMSDNWRRPFDSPRKQGEGTAAGSTSEVKSPRSATSSSAAGPQASPIKPPGSNAQRPSPARSLSFEKSGDENSSPLLGGQQSTRTWSRFFPSASTNSGNMYQVMNPSASPTGLGASYSGIIQDSDIAAFRIDGKDDAASLMLPQSVSNLTDDTPLGQAKPVVHLPPPQATADLNPSADASKMYASSSSSGYGQAHYSPELSDSSFPRSPQQIHSASLGGGPLETTSRDSAGSTLGYIGGKIPSINAIEAVQSRIAMTLSHRAASESNKRFTPSSPSGSPSKDETVFSGDAAAEDVSSIVDMPSALALTMPITTVESFEIPEDVSPTEKKTRATETVPTIPIKLAEYPQNYVPLNLGKKAADTFYLSKPPSVNFLGMVASAVSSASPASNPFNPHRRGGGSSAYKIMLPGMREHKSIPVDVSVILAASRSGDHHSSGSRGSRRGMPSWLSRRGGFGKTVSQVHQTAS
ncbi:hypothetical protein BZA70DRAFT_291809 [Myxozyma melibiosi]|uniref:Uncharacterized protein n=1 Tax=Myxozyma melibiosi TaxID=54550 RepID=A0ABR1EZH8_9ASCO